MRNLFDKVKRSVNNQSPIPIGTSNVAVNRFLGSDDDIERVAAAAYDAYGSVGTLFAIVTQICNAFAPVEWHLYRRTSVRDKSRRQEVLGHAFSTVWNNPNPHYTGLMFRETIQQHLDLVGEGIFVLYRVGSIVVEMWPVRPDRMHPVKHPEKFLTGWMYHSPDGERVPVELENVIQIKYPNPCDPYRGMGPVQTLMHDIDAARYAAEWNRNFFVNGAQPGGVVEVDYRMGDDEFNEFLTRWRQQHQGVANAHRVALLERAKWVDTKFSMEDMQFAELRNLPRELIREAFAFPKPMLGTVEDVNRANADAGKEIMAIGQTIPRLGRWKDVINFRLLPEFANGKALEAEPDDPTPVNKDAVNAERNSQATAAAQLVLAGYDPTAVTAAMGLPDMPYLGPPSIRLANQPQPDTAGNSGDLANALLLRQ